MPRPYPFPTTTGLEPTIAELLRDQTMHSLLARDGLRVADVKAVIRQWQRDQKRPLETSAAA